MTGSLHPAVARIAVVAEALGPLAHRVVFIGGAVAPLLQTDPPFALARPTSDVDAVIATASYGEFGAVQRELQGRGFRQDTSVTAHMHRWRGPDDIPFDLVPTGTDSGASGNPWDAIAWETAVAASVAGVAIRHASAPAYLALKWAAYADRGHDDPLASHDLEDILALFASRPTLVAECRDTEAPLRPFLAAQAAAFLESPHAEDLLAAHLNNADDPATTIAIARKRLEDVRLSDR